MTDTDELLPCPFCGSPATYVWDNINDVWIAGCTNGNCIVSANTTMAYGWPFFSESIKDARAAWNRRADHE